MSFNGHNDEVQTPFTAGLARQGVRFTSHYVYKFCSPTVGSLQTTHSPRSSCLFAHCLCL